MSLPDRLEPLFVCSEGEGGRLSQIGRRGIEPRDVLADVPAQFRRKPVSVAIETMAGGAEALPVEDCPALFRVSPSDACLAVGPGTGPEERATYEQGGTERTDEGHSNVPRS